MKDKEVLFARYPDLLDEQADAEMLTLIEQLDAAYATPEPPAHLTLAAALRSKAQSAGQQRQKSNIPWPRPLYWLPRRVSTIAAAVALAIVLMAGSAYAVAPLLSQIFQSNPYDPGLNQVFRNGLYDAVHLAPQSIGGFTIRVEAAYADSNRIIVGYTLTVPAGHTYRYVALRASVNTQYGAVRPGGGSGPVGTADPGGSGAYEMEFDVTNDIADNPGKLLLHLTVRGLVAVEQDSSNLREVDVPGSRSFDFATAFHPGRVARLDQSLTTDGKTLTLERVVVTPSETRAYLHGFSGLSWPPSYTPTLAVSDWPPQQKQMEVIIWSVGSDTWAMNFPVGLFDKYGTWTLEIRLADGDAWTFHFTVP